MNRVFREYSIRILFAALFGFVLYQACMEFYTVAWGTGIALGEFSLKWAFFFYIFVLFCVTLFLSIIFLIRRRDKFLLVSRQLISVRERATRLCWPLAILTLIFPVWFLQYTMWGVVFQGPYVRLMIWIAAILVIAFVYTKNDSFIGWKEFLAALVLTASSFSIAASLQNVTNYPFSLGWSEGNRLWDYSILFGRELYDYPVSRDIPVLLDVGRQFIGGLPFVFSGLTIGIERLWVGLTLIIPYILLGLVAFRSLAKEKNLWLITILWSLLFLKQGPIHPPLVLSAAMVALAWNSPLVYAMPLLAGAGYFAQASRYTWIFAPAMWIIMLEFASASFSNRKIAASTWLRTLTLGFSGLLGAFLLANIFMFLVSSAGTPNSNMPVLITPVAGTAPIDGTIPQIAPTATPVPAAVEQQIPNNTFFDTIVQLVTIQPLLWYRLLPNSTYGNGILLGLLIAVTPLLLILLYLGIKKLWSLNTWQKLSIILPLLAFLIVGLIASTKIGGGGDLHNMDMFLLGLFFAGVLAWHNGGREWILDSNNLSIWMKFVVVLLIIVPALGPWRGMRSYSFGGELSRLIILLDAPDEKSVGMLPSQDKVDIALETINEEVTIAREQGDVLFIDQRQLLTFGYIRNVPLVPEYEKKMLMNEALSSNAAYFEPFYEELRTHRFALIVSELLRTPIKDSSYQFGEENNAWVKWVSNPVLCYYEPKTTLKEVGVQLLVPKSEPVDCTAQLP